ncbi:TWF1-twinfilin an actin monomer sequestering [Fusarium napiforme]|uniref:TWF1-twinfilin an actin monomer sequestering n=1 Tax=Fusarium napiforme TaxID=42672 RepID=A0A8H5K677_9HYPO|nr:TWF1-twinfilin an actin monomer sequestering [Fusarium napiforme]
MFSQLFIVAFGVTAALSQTSYGEQFKYWGCATVDAAGFSKPVPLPNGILTPEACQAACAGHMFAAVSPDACRCGDDANAIKSVDEHSCNYPCTQDPNSPMCGGICPKGTPSISNLFIIEPAELQASEPVPQLENPLNQPMSINAVPASVAPQASFASDALPVATSSPLPGVPISQSEVMQAPPLSTEAVQQPPVTSVTPQSSTSIPSDPPVTSSDQPEQSPSPPTISFPSTLTLPSSVSPLAPAASAPDSTKEVPRLPPKFRTEPPTSETLVTETGSLPSLAPTQVAVSKSSRSEISMLPTIGGLLFTVMMTI